MISAGTMSENFQTFVCFVKKERIRRFRELLVGFYFHIARSAVCLMLYNMSLHSNTTERQPGGRISGERWRRALETQVVVRRKNRRRIFLKLN